MVAAFEYVEKDPRAEEYVGSTFAIGASDKGDDALWAEKLVKYFNANPQKLRPGLKVGIPPIVEALKAGGKEVSATILRQAIRNNDERTVRQCIPSGINVAEFLKIFNK